MKSIYKILGIFLILAAVSLSGCIGEDVPADDEADVVVVDDVIDDIADEPVADESDDAIEVVNPVEDELEEVSTPSSSGSLVAGVDGTTGHGAEIKAKYAAAEAAKIAAEEAEQARLEALAATLPAAINDSEEASLEAFAAEEVYAGACDLMNATIETNATLNAAKATTLAAFDNKTDAIATFDARDSEFTTASIARLAAQAAFEAYTPDMEESPESTAVFDELSATLNAAITSEDDALVARAIAITSKEEAIAAYNDVVDAEELSQIAYDEAVEALGSLTHEVIDELGVTAREAREAAESALAALEEAQEAYDILNPEEEPEE